MSAVLNPVVDHSQHSGVKTEGCSNEPFNLWMLFRSSGGKPRNVFGPVATGREKVRKHDNLSRTTLNTAIERLRNRGFGEFHMSRLDNRKLRLRGKASGRFVQHLIAFTTTRSMIDNNNANDCGHSGLGLGRDLSSYVECCSFSRGNSGTIQRRRIKSNPEEVTADKFADSVD
jgi:hypothetical protein